MTYARVAIAVVFGLVVGSLFSVTQNDLVGSLGKQGFLFLSQFLVLMLSAAITLPSNFRQRQVYFKHKSAEVYSDWVYYLGGLVVLELPLSIIEAFVLSLIPYFWIGLTPGAERYFYFFGILLGLECVGQSFSRFMAASTRTDVLANTLTTLYIFISGAISGFMPSYQMIGWWFRWYSWLNPVAYAYEGVMLNQFIGTSLHVAILGAEDEFKLGNISGKDYLSAAADLPRIPWGSTDAIKALDLGILFVFALFFDTIAFLRMRSSIQRYSHNTRRPRSFVAPVKISPAHSESTSECHVRKHIRSIETRNLSYSVSTAACNTTPNKTLLHNISAAFHSGRLTALMGESGAGKTTLLDVIAGYKSGGKIEGEVLVNGRPKDAEEWKKISGYAEQLNILNPYLSVLETLQFTARCLVEREEADRIVGEVLEGMELEKHASYAVGREDYDEGLEKGERKRLVVAVEMVKQPSVLFLDEPTTGLDAISAHALMRAVKRSTTQHRLVAIATIHAPSAHLFSLFDDLLLLEKGGHLVFTGTSQEAIIHFNHLLSNANLPTFDTAINPADFVISSIETLRSAGVPRLFNEAPPTDPGSPSTESKANTKINPGCCDTFGVLLGRQVVSVWRNPSYFAVRLTSTVVGAIFIGLLFLNLDETILGAVFSIAAIFYSVFLFVIPMQASVVPLIEDRAVLYRETVSGLYSHIGYAMALLLVDLPAHCLNALLYFLLFYFSVGFDLSAERMGYFFLMIFLANWLLSSIGQMFAFLSPNAETANGLSGLSVILSVLLMGFLISVFAMPEAWRWAYWANSLHYVLQGLCENQLAGKSYSIPLDIDVNLTRLAVIAQDPGQKVQQLSQLLSMLSASPDFNPSSNTTHSILDPPVADLLTCLVQNNCFNSTLALVSCTLDEEKCNKEVQAAGEVIGDVMECIRNGELNDVQKAMCVLSAILSEDWLNELLTFFRVVFKLVVFLVDVLTNGLSIPGELILYFFGWADFDDQNFRFVADYKWYYCLFAVAMFILSLEILKLIFIRYVSWVKR